MDTLSLLASLATTTITAISHHYYSQDYYRHHYYCYHYYEYQYYYYYYYYYYSPISDTHICSNLGVPS